MVDPASLHATQRDWAAKVLTAAFFTAATLLATGPAVLAQPASQGQQSSTQGSSCAGDNGGITLSPGFCATIFADNLGHARQMTFGPNGVLYLNTWSGVAPLNLKPYPIAGPRVGLPGKQNVVGVGVA